MISGKTIGFAITGSFCTFSIAIKAIEQLTTDNTVVPILSYNASTINTRFYSASKFITEVEAICGTRAITTIEGAEPIGPKKNLDILVIAPCTGNTLAKLVASVTDTPVLMAAKAHLRNSRPLLLAISTNDALSGNAKNIGKLLNYKNIYFVPFKQDDHKGKPRSIVADFSLIPKAAELALEGEQIQPILL